MKRSTGAYASDFYVGLVMPPGTRWGPQYRVADAEAVIADALRCGGAALFGPPPKSTVARCSLQRRWLPRLWICAAHQHRQCASCALVGRRVRHFRATGHVVHPGPSTALPGPRGGERRAAPCTPGVGGTLLAKRHRQQQQAQLPGAIWERLHKRGRVGTPPPPRPRGSAYGRRAPHGIEEQGRR